MTETQNPRHAQVLAKVAKLQADAALENAGDSLERLGRQLTQLRRQAQELGAKGYGAADPLDALASSLGDAARTVTAMADARLTAYRAALADALIDLQAQASAASEADEAAVAEIEAAASAFETQVRAAQRDLDGLTAPLSKALSDLDRHLSLIQRGVEAWAEFTGQRDGAEDVRVAADAEWVAGQGRDEAPDGTLYLTDKRLIFEQDEKVGKRLGLFGGKQVREVEWAINLSEIGGVRAKNAGMLGGRDMLYFDHGGREYTLEVKGRASNDDWAAYIERAKAGAFPVTVPDVAAPDDAGHREILDRLAREQAGRAGARQARKAAEAAAGQVVGALGAAAAKFGQKEDAGDEADRDQRLSGLAAAVRKANEQPDERPAPPKGSEKGHQSGGPTGGKAN